MASSHGEAHQHWCENPSDCERSPECKDVREPLQLEQSMKGRCGHHGSLEDKRRSIEAVARTALPRVVEGIAE